MIWYEKYKALWRLLVLYSIVLIIKGFDHSFNGLLDITLRGQVFSLFLISLWIVTWYLSSAINNRITKLKIGLRLGINISIGIFIGFLSNIGYRHGDVYLFGNYDLWKDIPLFNPEMSVGIMGIYMVIYAVHIYIDSLLQVKEEQVKSAQLAKENLLAQYKSLKAQVEPHFLFNSLSVLSSIMHSDIELASDYVLKLSKTLRYIIEKNKNTLVSLEEEMDLINDYFFLLKTRFGEKLQLEANIEEQYRKQIYLPPATLQLLVENAVKHNKHTEEHPLKISIWINGNFLLIENNLNKRQEKEPSLTVGLKNIRERYLLIASKDIIIAETDDSFCVKLPLLPKEHYESFNH